MNTWQKDDEKKYLDIKLATHCHQSTEDDLFVQGCTGEVVSPVLQMPRVANNNNNNNNNNALYYYTLIYPVYLLLILYGTISAG